MITQEILMSFIQAITLWCIIGISFPVVCYVAMKMGTLGYLQARKRFQQLNPIKGNEV